MPDTLPTTLAESIPAPSQAPAAHPGTPTAAPQPDSARPVLWLLSLALLWKLIELGVGAFAAFSAHSPALLAFSSDSVVEVVSAVIVLSQFLPGRHLSPHRAARAAAVLLFLLALVVAAAALGSLLLHLRPDTSRSGLVITAASLVVMPIFAILKRHAARRLANPALAADAVQSVTCAWLALVALLGLAAHAIFGIAWFDDLAALISLPLLVREARTAWHGQLACGC